MGFFDGSSDFSIIRLKNDVKIRSGRNWSHYKPREMHLASKQIGSNAEIFKAEWNALPI